MCRLAPISGINVSVRCPERMRLHGIFRRMSDTTAATFAIGVGRLGSLINFSAALIGMAQPLKLRVAVQSSCCAGV